MDKSSASPSLHSHPNVIFLSPNHVPLQTVSPTAQSPMSTEHGVNSTSSLAVDSNPIEGQAASVVNSTSTSQTPASLPGLFIETALPQSISITPLGQPLVTATDGTQLTTTTMTTITEREPFSTHHSSGVHLSMQRAASPLLTPLAPVALGPSDVLLVLKLLERYQGAVNNTQVVALIYSVVGDIGRALGYQLKANLDSAAPEVRRILTSTKAASTAARELRTFANSLYKTLKRSRIFGLKSKHNRLRMLATEASTRKWIGRELLEFVASLLQALETELTSKERVTVLNALVEKLKRRSDTTEGLGELYRAFDVVFPGSDEDAELHLTLHRKQTPQSLTFANETCHGCHTEFVGFRFRYIGCHVTAVEDGRGSISFPRVSSTGKSKATPQMEYLLCASCFVSCCSNSVEKENGSGTDVNDTFPLSQSLMPMHYKALSDFCSKQFICEMPLSILSPNSYNYQPFHHISIASSREWGSLEPVTFMNSDIEVRLPHQQTTSSPTCPSLTQHTSHSTMKTQSPALHSIYESPVTAESSPLSDSLDRFHQTSDITPNAEVTILSDGRIQIVSQVESELLTHTDRWNDPGAVSGSMLISEQSIVGTGRIPDERAVNTVVIEDSSGNATTHSIAAVTDIQKQMESHRAPATPPIIAADIGVPIEVIDRNIAKEMSHKSSHRSAEEEFPPPPPLVLREQLRDVYSSGSNVGDAHPVDAKSGPSVSISSDDDTVSLHRIHRIEDRQKELVAHIPSSTVDIKVVPRIVREHSAVSSSNGRPMDIQSLGSPRFRFTETSKIQLSDRYSSEESRTSSSEVTVPYLHRQPNANSDHLSNSVLMPSVPPHPSTVNKPKNDYPEINVVEGVDEEEEQPSGNGGNVTNCFKSPEELHNFSAFEPVHTDIGTRSSQHPKQATDVILTSESEDQSLATGNQVEANQEGSGQNLQSELLEWSEKANSRELYSECFVPNIESVDDSIQCAAPVGIDAAITKSSKFNVKRKSIKSNEVIQTVKKIKEHRNFHASPADSILAEISSSQLSRDLSMESGVSNKREMLYNSTHTVGSNHSEGSGGSSRKSLSSRLMNNRNSTCGFRVNQTIGITPRARAISGEAFSRSSTGGNLPSSISSAVIRCGAATSGTSPVKSTGTNAPASANPRASSKSTSGWSRFGLANESRSISGSSMSPQDRSAMSRKTSTASASHSVLKNSNTSEALIQQNRSSGSGVSCSVSSIPNADKGFAASLSGRRSRALIEKTKASNTMRF